MWSNIVLSVLGVYFYFFWKNETIRFWTKVIFFRLNILLFIPTSFIPFGFLRPKNVRNLAFIAIATRTLSKVYGLKYTIKGSENVKRDEPAVIVANHQSTLDVFTVSTLWFYLGQMVIVVKREMLYSGPFGLASYLCDTVYVDRSNPTSARASLNNAVNKLVNNKVKLWFFPEGTLNKTGPMLPFKKGAFHMAVQAQVPILPIVISPYTGFYNSTERKFNNGGHLTVKILPPVPTKGLTTNDIDTLVASVRNLMQQEIDTMNAELDNNNKN